MKVIIYGSKYGSTKKYAEYLAGNTNIPLIEYKEVKDINRYETIIYLGALYAGGVLGMKKTFKKLINLENKKIIIATVGLGDPKVLENTINIKEGIKRQLSNELYEKAHIYHLRGKINYQKLNVAHKTMMKLLYKKAKSLPDDKKDEETKTFIETYNEVVDFVDFNSLGPIIEDI